LMSEKFDLAKLQEMMQSIANVSAMLTEILGSPELVKDLTNVVEEEADKEAEKKLDEITKVAGNVEQIARMKPRDAGTPRRSVTYTRVSRYERVYTAMPLPDDVKLASYAVTLDALAAADMLLEKAVYAETALDANRFADAASDLIRALATLLPVLVGWEREAS